MSELRGYALSISRATGVTDPATIAEIEDFMRDEHRTLDHLDRQQFDRCARDCWKAVAWSRTPDGQAYNEMLRREIMGQAA